MMGAMRDSSGNNLLFFKVAKDSLQLFAPTAKNGVHNVFSANYSASQAMQSRWINFNLTRTLYNMK